MAKMKELPTDDPLFGKGTVRVDGRKMHDMYLFEVEEAFGVEGPWDYYKQIARCCRPSRPSSPLERAQLPAGQEVSSASPSARRSDPRPEPASFLGPDPRIS